MGQYRILLDGVRIQDEPKGLNEASLKIVRDEDLKGIFLQYTTPITFYGDGYDYIRATSIANRDCAEVACTIEYACEDTGGAFQVLFEGVIPIGSDEVEWDEYNCEVTTRVENADFSNFIQTYGDYRIKVNQSFCIDGTTPLSAITTNFTDFFTGFLGAYNRTGIVTYKLTDLLQQALEFLSNGSITLDEDSLYSTLYEPQTIQIEFVSQPANGDIITVNFTNYYGQEYQIDFNCSGTVNADLLFLSVQLLYMADPTLTPYYLNRTNDFQKASNTEWTSSGAFLIDITNYLPWRSFSISISDPGKTVTMTETNAFVYGLKNLGVTSSTNLQEQSAETYYTLNQILEHTSQFNNMGFRLVNTGVGQYDFQLRQQSSLINNTDTLLNLQSPNAIKSRSSGMFNIATLTTPDGKADNVFKKQSFVTEACYGDQLKLSGQNYSSQEFFDVINNTQIQDDELYFFFLKDGDYTLAEQFIFKFGIFTVPVISDDYFHYNIPYLSGLIPRMHFINSADNNLLTQINNSPFELVNVTCSNCPDASILNDNIKLLLKEYEFEHFLTFNQAQILINQSLNYINFGDGKRFTKQGFIKEIDIPFNNFIASFTVYAD